jgi:hypothetical protein
LVAVTLAEAMEAPVGSRTVPVSVPVGSAAKVVVIAASMRMHPSKIRVI